MGRFMLKDNISLHNAYEIKEELLAMLQKEECELLIDFQQVGLIDSTGLGVLVAVLKQAQQKQVSLKLVSVNDNVRKIFQLTRLDTVFELV